MVQIALRQTFFILLVFLSVFPASAIAVDDKVAVAQQRLSELGFEPGPIDGLMGPQTRAALRGFQRKNAIKPSGRLDAATLKALFPAQPNNRRAKVSGMALSYTTLGWRRPDSGENTLLRFRSRTGSLDMRRSSSELIVPDGNGVYLIESGDAVPGFDCDPGHGQIEMELMLGPKGPVVFRPLDKKGYCQLGFGILLKVGQRLRMAAASWDGGAVPRALVEVGTKGLMYVDSGE